MSISHGHRCSTFSTKISPYYKQKPLLWFIPTLSFEFLLRAICTTITRRLPLKHLPKSSLSLAETLLEDEPKVSHHHYLDLDSFLYFRFSGSGASLWSFDSSSIQASKVGSVS
ncbi:hypothetical protein L2E82_07391 [Cichorium intybus]|uniref:Uncharacterized protein n=1 Tax=Cichorium intybus TaxID=13427 RepID=A0ACB9G5D0_CICIN|nr:hypothetical protein L2E82_07391 [Cichorium intybus]